MSENNPEPDYRGSGSMKFHCMKFQKLSDFDQIP